MAIMTPKNLSYMIHDPIELNLSYMPFIANGGLFIPTEETFLLGDTVKVDLQFKERKDILEIEGKVIWITPRNALHHVLPGIGIQFTGANALNVKNKIESDLDKTNEIGGYTYGITEKNKS